MKKNLIRNSYSKDDFKLDIKFNGPQGQLVYILRFPVSYKNNQLVSQRVDFPAFFDWMGQIREYSLRPVTRKILKLTETGKWGMATNSVKIRVYDFLTADDVLEGRLWMDRISGHDNIFNLAFDWLRCNKGSYERVATSSIVITCVDIIGHGQAVIVKPPKFLKTFFESMRPKDVKKKPLPPYKTCLSQAKLGNLIKSSKDNSELLFESNFQTTLENSNLIGNIYFSNYGKWINSTKDLFLYQKNASLFDRLKFEGEFVTLECKISHSNEAMPFDKVGVKMYLKELYANGAVLTYEVLKDTGVRLAKVVQTIAYVKYQKSRPVIQSIPSYIIGYFNG